jgi:hypothetical protein
VRSRARRPSPCGPHRRPRPSTAPGPLRSRRRPGARAGLTGGHAVRGAPRRGRRPRGLASARGGGRCWGAAFADARLAALDAGSLRGMHGREWEGGRVVLEPVREHGAHASARVAPGGPRRAGGGPAARAGIAAAVGRRPARRGPEVRLITPGPRWAEVVLLAGRVAPLGKYDAFQGRRGAHAALEVDRLRRTGAWRGGWPGALDGCGGGRRTARPRAAGEGGGAAARDGARAGRAAVGGGADRLPALGARAPARGVGQNVVLLAMLALGGGDGRGDRAAGAAGGGARARRGLRAARGRWARRSSAPG